MKSSLVEQLTLLAIALLLVAAVYAYDPDDEAISTILPPVGSFEPFYLKGSSFGGVGVGAGGEVEGEDEEDDGSESARAPHAHGTFYKYRHPALVDAKNAAAYGFRFDGGRRFNYDRRRRAAALQDSPPSTKS